MTSPDTTPTSWWRRLECRLDAWAATKLTAEEYADAVVLDREIKANFWRWLGYFFLVAAGIGVLVKGIWPRVGFGTAIFYSALGLVYVSAAALTAWYGYRKYTRKPVWVMYAIFITLLLAGAATGYAIGNLKMGRALTEIDPERAAKALAIAVLIGTLLASFLIGIAHLRLREARHKAARLEAEADRERLARQGVQAELKLLQAQVEPHFLFNTLANLRYLVQTGSADALPMLDHLIRYLRTSLPELRAEASTLGREAELARAYLEIMRLRMGGALEVSVDIPPQLTDLAFPPLMLGTLVENAVKHGVAPQGQGRIAIRAREEGGRLRIEVEDDGRGLAEPIGQGLGLANIRERLRALHGERASLELLGREPSGTLAVMEVPQ